MTALGQPIRRRQIVHVNKVQVEGADWSKVVAANSGSALLVADRSSASW